MTTQHELPYFDTVLEFLNAENPDFLKAFGRHVHWGYWEDPSLTDLSVADFATAAENMCAQVFKIAQIQSGQQILDVGCGLGGTIASLNDTWCNLSLAGLNIDQRQLDIARRLVTPSPTNRIDFFQGDACSLPFEDASFDRILAVECIFHFSSRKRFFAESKRVLRHGGRLFVSDIVPTPLLLSFKSLVLPLLGPALSKTFGQIDNETTLNDYLCLATECGFYAPRVLDITRQTLPTHPFMRRLYKTNAPDIYRRQLAQEIAVELLSRTGLLRYMLISWQAGSA